MIQVLLIDQDPNFIDLVKALCCNKGCKVLVADNSHKLLYFLYNENIDIVFFKLSSLNSLSFDMIFSIYDFDHKRPVILISEKIGLSEEIELLTRNIFYRATKPVNSDEIEQVLEAAINAVSTKMSEKGYNNEEIMVTENSINQKQIVKWKQKYSMNIFRSNFRRIPKFDSRIISLICGFNFKYLEIILSFVSIPVKRIDTYMLRLAQGKLKH